MHGLGPDRPEPADRWGPWPAWTLAVPGSWWLGSGLRSVRHFRGPDSHQVGAQRGRWGRRKEAGPVRRCCAVTPTSEMGWGGHCQHHAGMPGAKHGHRSGHARWALGRCVHPLPWSPREAGHVRHHMARGSWPSKALNPRNNVGAPHEGAAELLPLQSGMSRDDLQSSS